jgi:ATP-dependent Lon protease
MTGEISLRGSVLPVGGIKSKVLAAHREGIRRVVLPLRNKKDVSDIPDEIFKDLQIVFVDTIEDMLDAVIDGGIRGDTKGEDRHGAIADIESANALLSNL